MTLGKDSLRLTRKSVRFFCASSGLKLVTKFVNNQKFEKHDKHA